MYLTRSPERLQSDSARNSAPVVSTVPKAKGITLPVNSIQSAPVYPPVTAEMIPLHSFRLERQQKRYYDTALELGLNRTEQIALSLGFAVDFRPHVPNGCQAHILTFQPLQKDRQGGELEPGSMYVYLQPLESTGLPGTAPYPVIRSIRADTKGFDIEFDTNQLKALGWMKTISPIIVMLYDAPSGQIHYVNFQKACAQRLEETGGQNFETLLREPVLRISVPDHQILNKQSMDSLRNNKNKFFKQYQGPINLQDIPEKYRAVPRRPFEHVLGDIGVSHFTRAALKAGFLVDRISQDYGIDLNVYTFDSNQNLETGMICIQSKAQGHVRYEPNADSPKYAVFSNLKTSNINAWLTAGAPVFLVVYDHERNTAYWEQVDRYFSETNLNGTTNMIRIPVDQVVNAVGMRRMQELKNEWYAAQLDHHLYYNSGPKESHYACHTE